MQIAWCLIVLASVAQVDSAPPKTSTSRKSDDPASTSLQRSLAFLSREVPKWSKKNDCFSCHNNGDGARVLYRAMRLSKPVDALVLSDTTRWLSRPDEWKNNRREGPSDDAKLATIQFAWTLAEATRAGAVSDRGPLLRAADMLAAEQDGDGSWAVELGVLAGSPVTYGRYLATVVARDVLNQADAARFEQSIQSADRWLRSRRPQSVLDSAAVLMALANCQDKEARLRQRQCVEVIGQGQRNSGGWGPYVSSAPEVFDTAVVLLALSQLTPAPTLEDRIRRGRQFLLDSQLADGSWPETTRPPNFQSYAQQVATTAWATMALLETK